MENVKGICGNQEGAKHKHGVTFPTTQGATFPNLKGAERGVGDLTPVELVSSGRPTRVGISEPPLGLSAHDTSHLFRLRIGIISVRATTDRVVTVTQALPLSSPVTLDIH